MTNVLSLLFALLACHAIISGVQAYGLVDPDELENDEMLQNMLRFGVEYVIDQGIQAGELPNSDYEIYKVYDVYRPVSNGVSYKFDVELRNQAGSTVRTGYTIDLHPWSNEKEMNSFEYYIDDIRAPEFLNEEFDAENEQEFENDILHGFYMDPSDFETDKEIQVLLDFGIQYMTQELIDEGWLPRTHYELANIDSVSQDFDNDSDAAYYNIEVHIQSGMGWLLEAQFIFYDKPSTETRYLLTYDYNVLTVGEEEEDLAMKNEKNEDTKEEEKVEGLFNDEDQCAAIETISDDELVNRLGEIENAGEFAPIDFSDIKGNPVLLELVEFGTKYIVEQGISSGVLKGRGYEVYDVFGVESRMWNGVDYKFDVELRNYQGNVARVIFIVYYQDWTNKGKVLSYAFENVEENF